MRDESLCQQCHSGDSAIAAALLKGHRATMCGPSMGDGLLAESNQ